MTLTKLSIGIILVVVIAVAFTGCTSTSPTTTSTSGAPSGGTSAPTGGAGASASSSVVTGSSIFGNAPSYNWVEYKMTSGSGSQQMTIYIKWDKSGKCTMRFEGGANMPAGVPTEMDCSAQGGKQAQTNPNQVSPDVKFAYVGPESVTVPAGTFTADKYTATIQGYTSTYWIANGKPLIKMQGGNAQGSSTMELNGWG